MAKFIKLTVIGSGVEYLNMDLATSIRPVARDTWAAGQGARSAVNIFGSQGGNNYDVTETPEQILALIDQRGAASPDLLEACKRALDYVEADETQHGRTFGVGNELRTAIAKATGAA